jgi:pheromone a factor receptor
VFPPIRQRPVVHTETDTIVQDRRFLIVKDLGCQVAVHNSIPALIIVWLPPLCISTVAILYCCEPTNYDDIPSF